VGGPDTALMYSVGNALASIPVSAPFAFMMCGAALTEIHLCHAYSCQAILMMETARQGLVLPPLGLALHRWSGVWPALVISPPARNRASRNARQLTSARSVVWRSRHTDNCGLFSGGSWLPLFGLCAAFTMASGSWFSLAASVRTGRELLVDRDHKHN
jgi:hypothetical protein